MSKRAEIGKEPPSRPMNFYFRFRAEQLKKHKGEKNTAQIVREEWEKISAQEKERAKVKDQAEMEKYKSQLAVWKKDHP